MDLIKISLFQDFNFCKFIEGNDKMLLSKISYLNGNLQDFKPVADPSTD